jgi:hypothetical protein
VDFFYQDSIAQLLRADLVHAMRKEKIYYQDFVSSQITKRVITKIFKENLILVPIDAFQKYQAHLFEEPGSENNSDNPWFNYDAILEGVELRLSSFFEQNHPIFLSPSLLDLGGLLDIPERELLDVDEFANADSSFSTQELIQEAINFYGADAAQFLENIAKFVLIWIVSKVLISKNLVGKAFRRLQAKKLYSSTKKTLLPFRILLLYLLNLLLCLGLLAPHQKKEDALLGQKIEFLELVVVEIPLV